MLGAGSLWGPRQSLPASGWSGRRTCSCQLAWAGGGGVGSVCQLSLLAAKPCRALALRPTSKAFRGASQERDSCPPGQQCCHNRELSMVRGGSKARPTSSGGGPRCSWFRGSGFPSSITLGRATHCPGIGFQGSVQVLADTLPQVKRKIPAHPDLSGEYIHSAIIEHFLNAGATTGQIRQGPVWPRLRCRGGP